MLRRRDAVLVTGGDYFDPVAFGTIENALSEKMGRPDALEPSVDDDARRRNRDRLGQARADALVELCADSLAGDHGDEPAKPLVVATTSLESLLSLVNEGGAQVRTIVLDDTGQAVGVGKKSYLPPGWVRETMLALQHECGTPGCRVAARLCDLDHVVPLATRPLDAPALQPPRCRRRPLRPAVDRRRGTSARHEPRVLPPDGP